jgi:hypothetical protein
VVGLLSAADGERLGCGGETDLVVVHADTKVATTFG